MAMAVRLMLLRQLAYSPTSHSSSACDFSPFVCRRGTDLQLHEHKFRQLGRLMTTGSRSLTAMRLSAVSGASLRASAIASTSSSAWPTASLAPRRPFSASALRHKEPTSAASSSTSVTDVTPLSWDRYLRLRKQRRIAGVVTSVPTTALAALASGSYFLTQEIDPTASPLMGIDPVYVYALLTLGCTGLGYLVGPSVGSALWALVHSKDRQDIDVKDKVFYDHIVRNRVDPSRQTMQNRLPDFYGEKVGSLKDYRQWLRDQATFRRKAAHGVDDDLRNV